MKKLNKTKSTLNPRKLTLNRETIALLTFFQLGDIVGGVSADPCTTQVSRTEPCDGP
jgi:hypothetical protein